MSRQTFQAVAIRALGIWVGLTASAAPRKHVIVDGNRTRAVHHIPLLDELLNEIRPDDNPVRPFSSKMTCGDCHDYDQIGMGWHFNSSRNITKPGRPGEPWVIADENTGTQLPVSYRDWPGTWRPDEIGMTPWEFLKTFGHHLPGGDMGEKDEEPIDPNARWDVSGKLEINCLACHNASAEQNQSEWAIQVARENLRWAFTGASAVGIVENMASRLPGTYDVLMAGPNLDNAWAATPEVKYEAWRFSPKSFVFFDVTREGLTNRCYYCHSTVPASIDPEKVNFWDKDVHMSAGMLCTDCHRNGLDHSIVRGYEGEERGPAEVALTCKGCHLGDPAAGGVAAMGGRMGAPRPLHRGFPPVHLKIACTACHSGYLPGDKPSRVRTARANRLGIHGRAQWDMDVPRIVAPVFIRNEGGKIEPREMMWPAFWGRIKGDKVTPMPLDEATAAVNAIREADRQAELEAERQRAAAQGIPPESEKPPAPPQEKPAESGSGENEPANAEAAPAAEKPAAEAGKPAETEPPPEAPKPVEELKPLTETQIVRVLAALTEKGDPNGKPVYVSGGKLYRLAAGGKALEAADHPTTRPYSWPLAHDVRPASQSLGSGGCGDCHEEDTSFFYADVQADSPTGVGQAVVVRMHELEGLNPGLLAALHGGTELRCLYLIAGVAAAILIAVALIHRGLHGLEGIMRLLVAPG